MAQHEELQYDRDEQARVEIQSMLNRWGYNVDIWTMQDKPDGDRVLTIKAGRNLAAVQLRLDEAQG